jgi:8-oxo-dGTP pyrophosphatase MutT (NUDIX family)
MSDLPAREDVYSGELFRIQHQPVPGRANPYEFASRIGIVTAFPIIIQPPETPLALVIRNERRHYDVARLSLPGGHQDGGFDHPEAPGATAVRELQEETGYGFAGTPNMDIFRLRSISHTIDYPRFLAVMRGVVHLGGAEDNPNERVTLRPISLHQFAADLLHLRLGELQTEINTGFAKAGLELGHEAVMSWLVGSNEPGAAQVPYSFEPWMKLEVA